MTEWKDGRRCLHVGLSGLQYHTHIVSPKNEDTVLLAITDFYTGRRGHRVASGIPHTLQFTRGSVWFGRLACLLPLSETWPFQTISVALTPDINSTIVDISYDVRIFFSLICTPNRIEKEAKRLKAVLEKE